MSSEINDCVRRTLNRYFRDLDGQAPHAVYDMVLKCVERPMLEVVMKQAAGHQDTTKAEGTQECRFRTRLDAVGQRNSLNSGPS